jgi:hypothetical protein
MDLLGPCRGNEAANSAARRPFSFDASSDRRLKSAAGGGPSVQPARKANAFTFCGSGKALRVPCCRIESSVEWLRSVGGRTPTFVPLACKAVFRPAPSRIVSQAAIDDHLHGLFGNEDGVTAHQVLPQLRL